jgi:hypothetical protein
MRLDKATIDALTAASVDLSSLRGIERRMDVRMEDDGTRERSYAARLLADVQSVLQDGEKAILSRTLLDRLYAIHTAPWRTYNRVGLTAVQLAQLLGVFGVESGSVRVSKTLHGSGYYTKALRDAKA